MGPSSILGGSAILIQVPNFLMITVGHVEFVPSLTYSMRADCIQAIRTFPAVTLRLTPSRSTNVQLVLRGKSGGCWENGRGKIYSGRRTDVVLDSGREKGSGGGRVTTPETQGIPATQVPGGRSQHNLLHGVDSTPPPDPNKPQRVPQDEERKDEGIEGKPRLSFPLPGMTISSKLTLLNGHTTNSLLDTSIYRHL